jgi:formylglycine-generating enzyme required for sulfatase activity
MIKLVESRRIVAATAMLLGASCGSGEPTRADVPEVPVSAALPATKPAALPAADSVPPPSAEPASAPAPLPEVEGMALVPQGPFTMGAEQGGEPDERPAHQITLPPFYLDLTEVTNEAYGRCVAATACPPPDPRSADKNHFGPDARFRGPRQPVSSISWESARGYCAWLGKRLPTEAEWEKAARSSDGRRFPWGNEPPTPERAVFNAAVTADVGTHPRGDGPYGHHDMAGNVWEWVEDVYDPYAYTRPGAAEGKGSTCQEALEAFADIRSHHGKRGFTGANPLPTECERVLRGGAFNYLSGGLRSTNRVHHPPRYHLVMSGFRCAKDAETPGGHG